jgi:DNA-binding transcriptional LysR family regulator
LHGLYNPGVEARANLNWDDLRYFLAIARKRTLAGAARELKVEHTTAGRRLGALEAAVGAPLALRRPDGIELTRLGRALVVLAEDVERAVDAVVEVVASERARVRVAVPSGFVGLFDDRLAELGEREPAFTLELVSGSRSVDLKRGEADVALRIGPIADPELVARKVGEVGFSLYASRAYLARRPAPADVDDLRGHRVVGYDRSLGALPPAKWLEARAKVAAVVLRCREMVDMLDAARAGAGLAVLPCFLGSGEPKLVRLTPRVVATGTILLVHPREAARSRSTRALLRFLSGVLADQAGVLRGTTS